MKKHVATLAAVGLATLLLGVFVVSSGRPHAAPVTSAANTAAPIMPQPDRYYGAFEVQVLVNGRPLEEYAGRGRVCGGHRGS
jgi:hypothetical protein